MAMKAFINVNADLIAQLNCGTGVKSTTPYDRENWKANT
jgi:hypothetical protein